MTDNKKKIDWHEEYQEKWLSLDGESLVADPKKLEDWIEVLCESIRAEALKEVDYFAETLDVDKEFEGFTHFENGFDHFRSKLQAKLAVLAKLSKGGTNL